MSKGVKLSYDELKDLENEISEVLGVVYNPNSNRSIEHQRKELPIYKSRKSILYIMKEYRILIIIGETGSGKTTQIPQYLYESGWASNGKIIGCTQPRRISCVSVAKRVSEEVTGNSNNVGGIIGYDIQFDHCCGKNTKVKYMTDGMLIREMMIDPLLSNYSVLMIDEAHERSLHTDILIGLLKKIMKKNKSLKVIISSATLEAERFQNFFSCEKSFILSVEGRQFPVEIFYLSQACSNYIHKTCETIFKIHKFEGPGDILAFLTGQDEIHECIKLLQNTLEKESKSFLYSKPLLILPLYSALPIKDQMKVFESSGYGKRKVIISTNISEASVTIPGIVYVVDSGFSKERIYNASHNKESLIITEISQASAKQRSGRAGRIQKGKAFRLYKEKEFKELKLFTIPEIQRMNLIGVVLQLMALGISNILHFDFLSPPPSKNIAKGLEMLYLIGAINVQCKLTKELGYKMAEFPVEPKLSKILIESYNLKCTEEILTISAFLNVKNVFSLNRKDALRVEKIKKKFAVLEGDFITFLNIYKAFLKQQNKSKWCKDNLIDFKLMKRMLNVRKQLRKYLKKFNIKMVSCNGDIMKIQKCICTGYFENVAFRNTEGYYTPIRGNKKANMKYYIHPSSVLFKYHPECIIYYELLETSKIYMRNVIKVESKWLVEICPSYFQIKRLGGTIQKSKITKSFL